LTALPESVSGTVNVHLDATEHKDNIVFLHAIQEGPASQSYGLQVAKLAGIPREVVDLAKRELHRLEAKSQLEDANPTDANGQDTLSPQSELFSSTANAVLQEMVEQLEPDELSPKEALNTLYKLKQLL